MTRLRGYDSINLIYILSHSAEGIIISNQDVLDTLYTTFKWDWNLVATG